MKTKKHEINIKDFERYIFSHVIASSLGNGSNKSLKVFVNPITKYIHFQVENKQEIVGIETELEKAIKIYNKYP